MKAIGFVLGMVLGWASLTAWAQQWPNRVTVTDSFQSTGTVIWSMPVTVAIEQAVEEGKNAEIVLTLRDYSGTETGLMTTGNGVALALVGTLRVTANDTSGAVLCTRAKDSATETDSSTGRAGEMIGCRIDSVPAGTDKLIVRFSGRAVIVKTQESLSRIEAQLQPVDSTLIQNGTLTQRTEVISGSSVLIVSARRCSIDISDTEVDFGTISAGTGRTGDLSAPRRTTIAVTCSGGADDPENDIHIRIDPLHRVTGDTTAIGLMMSDNTVSDALVVRAFARSGAVCSGPAITVGDNYLIGTVPAAVTSHTAQHPIYWRLCKKLPDTLPAGVASGTAVLTVNID